MFTSSFAIRQTLSFGFCLTGRSPPRKSEVSMCKWQLTEYNFWFAKAANTWQILVFPHLSEIHTRLTQSKNSKYTPTNTKSAKEEWEPHCSSRHSWLSQDVYTPSLEPTSPKHQHPLIFLIQNGTHSMNSILSYSYQPSPRDRKESQSFQTFKTH